MKTISLSKEDIRKLYADIHVKADRIIARLLLLMFAFGIFIALFYETWLVALGVGSLCLFAYFITKRLLPESNLYQYVLSAISAVFAAQYIYQMHGMAEMHFWVFISSTVLIIYHNWRLQIPLILIVYFHHGAFAYLQYMGYQEVYFTQLEYMDLTTFIFHAVLATGVCLVSGIWGYNIRKRTLQDALNIKTLSALRREVEDLNKDLMSVNRDVKEKNEELRASEEELLASAEELKQINENLNNLVENRTQALINQNKKLMQHAFINSHKVRSPLARILGLVNLLGHEVDLTGNGKEVLRHLSLSANELDDILKEVRINLEEAEFKEEASEQGPQSSQSPVGSQIF